MKVKKCDRCGRIYEKNSIKTEGDTYALGVAIFDHHGHMAVTHDLCDDCLLEFDSFMSAPEREKLRDMLDMCCCESDRKGEE